MAENQFHVTGAASGAQVKTAYTAGIVNIIKDGPTTFDQSKPTNIFLEQKVTEDSRVDKIMKRTISHFEAWNKNMVRTAALDQVLDKLNAGTTWLTIKGNPGEGKTTVGFMALEELHRCGRQVFELRTPEEFAEVISGCSHPVILLDDVFGSLEFDQTKWSNWAPVVCPLLKEREHKSHEEEDQTSNKDVTVILIGRDYVFNSASVDLERLSVFVKSNKHVVCMDHSLERGIEEKRAIWESTSKSSGVVLCHGTVNEILRINGPHGFPHVCRLFTTIFKENNDISACEFFKKPLDFLNKSISNLFKDTNKVMLFKELVTGDGEIRKKQLRKMDPTYKITQVANELVGSYLKHVEDSVVFDHPSIYDSVAFHMCLLDPEFVIEKCNLSFIHERVRLQLSEDSMPTPGSDSRLAVHVDRSYADDLAERFAREIMAENLVHVLSHQAFTERIFVSKVMSKIQTPLKSLLQSTDKTQPSWHDYTFICLVPSSKSPELLKFIDNCPEIELTEEDEKLILYGTCRYAAYNVLLYLQETRTSLYINERYDEHDCSLYNDKMTPLMIAAETRDVQFVEQILSLKPDLNARDGYEQTPLHYLCKNGLWSCVSQVIDSGVDIDSQDYEGYSAISHACRYNQLQIVRYLIEKRARIDAITFHAACKHARLDIVKLLCEDERRLSKDIVATSLSAAVERHKIDIDILSFLVTKGALVNASCPSLSPLHVACYLNKPLALQWLLQQGAHVDRRDREESTALHHAAKSSKECVDILLKAGATVNVQNVYGDTPLLEATERGSKDFVDVLLEAGASVNMQNKDGKTPLHCAAWRVSNDFVYTLLKAGVEVNAQNKIGNAPLHHAAESGSKERVAMLLKGGASVNVQNKDGDTPLHRAAWRGFKECVDVLLNGGAAVNAQNKDGGTPLHLTYRRISKECVKMLLKAGATVNVQNGNGDTPLHRLCAVWKKVDIKGRNILRQQALLLIDNGADVEIGNNEGTPALHGLVNELLQQDGTSKKRRTVVTE